MSSQKKEVRVFLGLLGFFGSFSPTQPDQVKYGVNYPAKAVKAD